jgi:ABC-type transporter Mla MlaB component
MWLMGEPAVNRPAMTSAVDRGPTGMATSASRTIAFTIRGPIATGDVPGLCDRVCALLGGGAGRVRVALCDVRGVQPTAGSVDALARLQLAARRTGCQVRLRNASPELLRLVDFLGLSDVLPD